MIERIVKYLLEGEDDDMLADVSRAAMDPTHALVQALEQNEDYTQTIKGRTRHSWDVTIAVRGTSDMPSSKLRNISVRWARSKNSDAFTWNHENGFQYASFRPDTPEKLHQLAQAIRNVAKAAQTDYVSNGLVRNAVQELMSLQWRPKHPVRRRRKYAGYGL